MSEPLPTQTPSPALEDKENLIDDQPPIKLTRKNYDSAVEKFDISVCEAIAVSQACSNRFAEVKLGFATKLFAAICNASISMIRATPHSRWVRSDFQHWALSGIATHCRAIIESHILLVYLMETEESEQALKAKMNVMHLNDCSRRIALFQNAGGVEEVHKFEIVADELRDRLRGNEYFCGLPAHVQKRCLDGESPMILTRQEMLEKIGWDRAQFRITYDLLSQHAHILPLSFYRTENNGRGSGVQNSVDMRYFYRFLLLGAETLEKSTNEMVKAFPDSGSVRKGKKSKFSPGPRENLPFRRKSYNM